MIDNLKKYIQAFIKECMELNDTPHRTAFALSLGVFIGILPFAGVVAAIALAMYFRLNKPAIVLGSLVTNTWLGFIVLGLAIQGACWMLKVDFHLIKTKIEGLFKNFSWEALSDPYITNIMSSVAILFFIISLLISFLAYIICFAVVYFKKPR